MIRTLWHTVLRYLRQPGAPVTVSPNRELRYGAGRVDRVAWAGGVDTEVVGPVPAPAMSGSVSQTGLARPELDINLNPGDPSH